MKNNSIGPYSRFKRDMRQSYMSYMLLGFAISYFIIIFFSFFYILWICNSPSLLAAGPLPSVSYKFTMWTFTFLVAPSPPLPTSLLRPSPERFFPLLPQSTLSFPKKRLYLKYSIVSHSECRKFSTGKVHSAKNKNKN